MSEWRSLRLGDHTTTYAGGTPDRTKPEYYGGQIPWVKSTEVNLGKIYRTEETLSELGLKCSAAKWIPEETVLVALYGATAAQIGYLKIRATANQAVLAIVPDKQIDSIYLFYALTAAKSKILYQAQGSGQPNLNKQIVDSLKVDAPPIHVQRKIARILTTVDNLIEKTEALIAKYQAIKQGMMHDLFTRGVDEHGHLRPPYEEAPELYKSSELGWIPKEWEIGVLGNEIGPIVSGWSPVCDSVPAALNEWAILKTTAVVWNGYDENENKRLPDKFTPLTSIEVKNDDILITRKGPVERVGVVVHVPITRSRLMIPDTVFRVRLLDNSTLLPAFVPLTLGCEVVQRDWFGRKVGLADAQVNVNHGILRQTKFPKPNKDEQLRIVERVAKTRTRIQHERRSAAKLAEMKTGLMQDLLTGKVRVKVDEAEEVASNG